MYAVWKINMTVTSIKLEKIRAQRSTDLPKSCMLAIIKNAKYKAYAENSRDNKNCPYISESLYTRTHDLFS